MTLDTDLEDQAADQAAVDKEYKTAWDELEAADQAAEKFSAGDKDDAKDDGPPEDDEGRDENPDAQDDEGDDAGDKLAGGASQNPEGPDSDLDWSSAPEPLRSAYKKLEHAQSSAKGRLAAQDRALNDLRSQLAEVTRSKPEPAAEDGEKPKNLDDLLKSLSSVREEYGEVVGPLADAIEAIASRVQGFDAREVERQNKVLTENHTRLEAEIPEWKFILGGENGERFPDAKAWAHGPDTPRKFGAIWEANLTRTVDPDGMAELVKAYADHIGIKIGETGGQQEQDANPINQRRQRQIEAASQPRTRGRPAISPSVSPNASREDAWNFWEKKESKG